jgi:hypothetical protein
MVSYVRLFEEDDSLNQTMFAETLRGQCLAERLEYLQVRRGARVRVVVVSGVARLGRTAARQSRPRAHQFVQAIAT